MRRARVDGYRIMPVGRAAAAAVILLVLLACSAVNEFAMNDYIARPTGLVPKDPPGWECSPINSLFGSMTDLDGSRRGAPHEGIDAGRLGEEIYAPADGLVIALWETDLCCGKEYSLLLLHTRADLNLDDGPPYYYSEFDHLKESDLSHLKVGDRVGRGQRIARVWRPGGKRKHLPEVHWEVYKVTRHDDRALRWTTNHRAAPMWLNFNARLVDPLQMMALEKAPDADGGVELPPFVAGRRYDAFKGFTYILPCRRRDAIAQLAPRHD